MLVHPLLAPSRWPATVLLGIVYVAAYVALDWISFVHPYSSLDITPWSPSPALSLLLLVRGGWRFLPFIFAGDLLSDILLRIAPGEGQAMVVGSLAFTVCYAAMAAPLRRTGWRLATLPGLRDGIGFTLLIVLGTGVTALGQIAVFDLFGLLAPGQIQGAILRYWLGDAIGCLVTVPLVVAATLGLQRPGRIGLAILASLAAALAMVFVSVQLGHQGLFYPLFLPVIWAALHAGGRGAALVVGLTHWGLNATLQLGDTTEEVFLSFQLVMIVLAVTGQIMGAVVSDRQRAERALAASERHLKTLVQAAPNGILTLDAAGRILSCNSAALALLGRAETAVIGQALAGLIEGSAGSGEVWLIRGDGGRLAAELSVAAIGEDGRQVAILHDLSLRHEAEALRAGRRAIHAHLDRIDTVGGVIAQIIHEISQPLAAIISYGRAARALLDRESAPDPRLTSILGKIIGQSERVGQILRRLRDFAQVTETDTVPLHPAALIEEAVELQEPALTAARIELTLELATTTGVRADPTLLVRVLANLLRNAIEALEDRPLPRRIHICGRSDPDGYRLSIADNGPGIDADFQDRLFQPFETTKARGMGLGLALSRTMVEAQGGTLEFVNVADGGAAFVIFLPVETAP